MYFTTKRQQTGYSWLLLNILHIHCMERTFRRNEAKLALDLLSNGSGFATAEISPSRINLSFQEFIMSACLLLPRFLAKLEAICVRDTKDPPCMDGAPCCQHIGKFSHVTAWICGYWDPCLNTPIKSCSFLPGDCKDESRGTGSFVPSRAPNNSIDSMHFCEWLLHRATGSQHGSS